MPQTAPERETDLEQDSVAIRCTAGQKDRLRHRAVDAGHSSVSRYLRDTLFGDPRNPREILADQEREE